jgi:hypothetical protein
VSEVERRVTPDSLAGIQRNSRLLLDGLKAKGGSGLRNLLTQMYPDQAHFLYELLQNAEDAGARNVEFVLRRDRMVFAHDGTRLFDLADIDSITDVADSTKRDDPTRIGKFGVGFKAVYDFTSTPEIHSGDYHFKIVDLFYPDDDIPPLQSAGDVGMGTVFVLPFDRPEKSANEAFNQIGSGLEELDASSLLFLRNISRVTLSMFGAHTRVIERIGQSDNRQTIRTTRSGEVEATDWLRVERTASVLIDDGEYVDATVAAAFRIADNTPGPPAASSNPKKVASPVDRLIEPVESGSVCIFFPAVKEHSGLKFHIHAPFESTVARDTIRDTPANKQLIAVIGELVADTVTDMALAGRMNDGLLSALPLADELGPAFVPIRDAVLEAFRTKPITPCLSGGYAPAGGLALAKPSVAQVLDEADLAFLQAVGEVSPEDPELVSAPLLAKLPPRDRARSFIRQLFSSEIDDDDVLSLIGGLGEECEDSEDEEAAVVTKNTHSWISGFSDDKLRRLYTLLGRSDWLSSWTEELSRIPIIRVAGDGAPAHVVPPDAILPDTLETGSDLQVSPSIWHLGASEDELGPAIWKFLKDVGVRVWNAETQLKEELAAFVAGTVTSDLDGEDGDVEIERLRRYIGELEGSPSQAIHFKRTPFLLGRHPEGHLIRCKPSRLYIDEPTSKPTGWNSVVDRFTIAGEKFCAVWEGYAGLDGLPEFLQECGALVRPRVLAADPRRNLEFGAPDHSKETRYKQSVDWKLELGESILRHGDVALRRQVWEIVLTAQLGKTLATYRPNGSAPVRRMTSNLVQMLRDTVWLPDADQNLCKPEELDVETIHPDFPVQDAPMLNAIGFGSKTAARHLERKGLDQAAQTLGFKDASQAERLSMLAESLGPDGVEQLMRERESRSVLPEEAAYGERRAARTADSYVAAPTRTFDMRQRSVRVDATANREGRRTYLRTAYESQGSVVCQACHEPMPFQAPDGRDYFEGVQCVEHGHDVSSNALALCPVCAAKFRSWRVAGDASWQEEIATFPLTEGQLSAQVPVNLAGSTTLVHFTGKHLKDLQVLIDSEPPAVGA